ncbi:MAG: hypothetical protein KC486_21715 [Myxococcales bacterium]|nr:hypothetical protein [Myxococcales bacterium]
MRHLTIPSAILLVLTAAACEPLAPGGPGSDPGQDPNPDEVPDDGVDEGPGDAGFIECEETITVLDGVDAASPLPFTAVDVLSLVIGERTTDMTWGEGLDESLAKVNFGPEAGAGELTIDVAYDAGEIRYVESTLAGGGDDPYGECPDRLEIDVDVQLTSAGGALKESFTAPIAASVERIAVLRHTLELDAVAGAFSLDAVEPADASVGPLELELGVTPDGLFGQMTAIVEVQVDDFIGATWMSVARWPGTGASPCEFGEAPLHPETAAAGFSAGEVLDYLAKIGEVDLTWGSGETTTLGIDFDLLDDETMVCASITSGALRIPTLTKVSSADGRWEGAFPMEVRAEVLGDGSMGMIRAEIPAPYAAQIDADAFAEHYGIADVDLAGFDRGILSFSADIDFSGEPEVDGSFEILGVVAHTCPPDANGCEGDSYTTLEEGSWGTL